MASGERALILVTCDDGLDSPGLRAAAQAVLDLGDVLIASPYEQQTGAGRSLLTYDDAMVYEVDYAVGGVPVPAYAVRGSPAQAVLYALTELVPRRPALCISGINFGENVGSGVTASGTVGAAMEAADDGVPSLAVSLETDKAYHYTTSEEVDFSVAGYFTGLFAQRLLGRRLPRDVDLLKVEVPRDATPQTPWRMTRISRQHYYQAIPGSRQSRIERRLLDYEMVFDPARLEPDSDIYALLIDRVVAVSPLSLDLTSRISLQELEQQLR